MKNNFKNTKIIISILTIFILTGCFGKEKIILIDKLEFEINSEVPLISLIKNPKDIDIVNHDELIDTSKLGEKEITIKYYNKKKEEKNIIFKIKIVDTTSPSIECLEIIETSISNQLDLLKDVKVTDNSGEIILPTVEGEYDYDKVGEYNLKYVATDISGNKIEKPFVLKVNEASIKKTGYYVYNMGSSLHGVKFKENGEAIYEANYCPGSGCGAYGKQGTYVINGNKLIATMTTETSEMGVVEMASPNVWEFTIINENEIDYNNQLFRYQETFW